MRPILQTFLSLVAITLFSSATSVAPLGACHLLPGGGGSGVWVLPLAGVIAQGERSGARLYDGNGMDLEIPDFCERGGDDMYLGSGGTLAIVYGFFDSDATEGTWYDVTNGETSAWYREDT